MKINFSNHYNSLILSILAIIFWLSPLTNYNCYSADDPVGPPAPASVPAAQNDWNNNILKQNTTELIEWVKITASKTTNFVSEQTPLYIQEYLAWIFWENLLWTVIIFSSAIIFPCLAIKFYKQIKGWDEYPGEKQFNINNVIFLVFVILSTISLISVLTAGFRDLSTVIKVKVAPRVIIVEKIKELTK